MTTSYKIIIPGIPVPKARPKVACTGKHAIIYTPAKTREYEKVVESNAAKQIPAITANNCPIRMKLVFCLKRPKGRNSGYPSKKPDIDNLIKSVMDGLKGVCYNDDSQVVAVDAVKVYGDNPQVEVWIENI